MAISWNAPSQSPSSGGITWNNSSTASAALSAPSAPPQSFADQIWTSLSSGSPLGAATSAIGSGVQNIINAPSDIANQFQQGVAQSKAGGAGAVDTLHKIGGIATALSAPFAPILKPAGQVIGAAQDAVTNIPAVQNAALKLPNLPYGQAAQVAGDVGNIAGTLAGFASLAKATPQITQNAASIFDRIAKPVPQDTSILESYTKAVKPTIAGKQGVGQLDKYNSNAVSAIKAIAENKDSLMFASDSGVETGRFPQSRGELADAVGQAKQAIFTKYNDLVLKANGTGVQVPLEPAASALGKVVENKALQLSNPNAIAYAQSIQSRFMNPDGTFKAIDPKTAQDVITNYNTSLKAFYRNPTYDTASHAAIDAGVVTELRKSLDNAVTSAQGGGYQALKNQYGALMSVEKDVNKAALAMAKQTGTNISGLGKYVDIFSGGDMVTGLMSLNPALFAKGLAQTGISHYFQWLNSPDRAVGNMFKGLEDYSNQPDLAPQTSQPTNSTPMTKKPISPKSTTPTENVQSSIPKDLQKVNGKK